ncbi:MAG TPA: relaxase domain-containing protein, partial [Dermatophilaceae bacterium]|nr:relaxase domain-containing protein [Dermatophilaceae bacterium]
MMTVHVLHAGDGYTYLTRQVASGDVQRERGQELADYYTAQGAPPGRWAGRGAVALGMEGQVTEAHMKALFGEGLHPDADRLTVENIRAGMNAEAAIEATRLGRKFPRFANDNPFGEAVMAACKEHSDQTGKWPAFTEKKAIEQRIARERMEAAGIVGTVSDDEVRAYIKSQRNTPRQPVAGYDLVFTPAKSV